jgi:hypothetical protein
MHPRSAGVLAARELEQEVHGLYRKGNTTQGVYNRLLLVLIVGGACFLRHQLAAVFNASFAVFQMTYEISCINRMGEKGDFCDAMPTYL